MHFKQIEREERKVLLVGWWPFEGKVGQNPGVWVDKVDAEGREGGNRIFEEYSGWFWWGVGRKVIRGRVVDINGADKLES